MLFNSMHFLLFFPIVAILYYVIPHKFRWVWLLITSYYFYMAWNPYYAVLMALSSVITYASGQLIYAASNIEDEKRSIFFRKLWVGLSFGSNLAILFFFKYFDFTVANINHILSTIGIEVLNPAFDVLLPVGISFYTFQALSYTLDAYRGDVRIEKNLGKYMSFVSFFPQLVAGPIERSSNLLNQIHEKHKFDYTQVKFGLVRMAYGFFLKLVIADNLAVVVDTVYNNPDQYTGVYVAVATIAFAFQIYCDFSGYSEIAIGAAQAMGFRLMENFRQPYFSLSIKEFWQRWHISLSTWFRDYLYIPLGGNRKSKLRKYCNTFIVFLVSGLWHGSSWNYVVWGMLHGLYQIIGETTSPIRKKIKQIFKIKTHTFGYKIFQMLCTFSLVCFAWIFFRAKSLESGLAMVQSMFSVFTGQNNFRILFDGSLFTLGLEPTLAIAVMLSVFGFLLIDFLRRQGKHLLVGLNHQGAITRWVVYIAIIFFIIFFGAYGPSAETSGFIYFQF